MPDYLKSIGNGVYELVLVRYTDSPRFEVRLYSIDLPYDHRTLIATDVLFDAERIYGERAACL
jgi:hypothetical protein